MFIIAIAIPRGRICSDSLLLKLSLLAGAVVLLLALSGSLTTNLVHPLNSAIRSKENLSMQPSLASRVDNSIEHPVTSRNPFQTLRASSPQEAYSDLGQSLALPSSNPPALTYQGGPVMHNPTAYAIFWLPQGYHYESGLFASDSNYESLMTRFLEDLNSSSYLSILTQYPDNTVGSPSDTFYFGGSWIDTTPYVYIGYNLSDFYFPNEIMHAINVNGWPEGANAIYFLFTAENVLPQLLEAGMCAYHSYFTDPNTGENVVWANIPDIPQPGCELPTPTPNFDQFADSSINLMSHELFESVTDPLISAWIDSNGNEIGDKCAWTFGPQVGNYLLEPNADVELNGHYYRVQQEWSNAANGCTLSGPPTFTDLITLGFYKYPIQAGDYFPINYVIGGQSFVFHDTGGTISVVTDPFSAVTMGGMSSFSSYESGKVWCFDSSCDSYSFTSSANRIALEYYYLVGEDVGYSVSDGSAMPGPPSLSYLTASFQLGMYGPSQSSITLSTSQQTIWVLNGSTVSLTPLIFGSMGERWEATQPNYTLSFPNALSTVEYYHQYQVAFSSTIIGGGTGYSPPSVSYMETGSPLMAANGSKVWVDAGSLYHYPLTLSGSGSDERWITNDLLSGTISSPETISPSYLHQYYVNLNIMPAGSGSLSKPSGWYNATQSITLSVSPSSGWLFQGWTGTGTGSYSGSNNPTMIAVNGPISEEAVLIQPSTTSSTTSSTSRLPTSSSTSQSTQLTSASTSTSSSSSLAFPPPSSSTNTALYLEIAAAILIVVVASVGYVFLRRKHVT
jgi:hypothetical protein